MSPHVHTIRAGVPWGTGTFAAEQPQRETAPTQQVTFTCERGHERALTFAAGAAVPGTWECRCGKTARRDGAPPEDTGPPVLVPAQYERPEHKSKTPWDHVKERRSKADLEQILSERMAEVRQGGWSR